MAREQDMRKHRDRALAYTAAGKPKAALAEYRKMLTLQPRDAAVRQKVAELEARLGRPREAIAEYEEVAAGYAQSGFLLKAIAICKVILQLDPAHRATQDRLAELCARERDDRERRGPRPAATTPAAAPPPPEPIDLGALRALSEPAAPEADLDIEIELDEEPLTPLPAAPAGPPAGLRTPLFSDLPPEVFTTLLERLELRAASAGEVIVAEGDRGDSMFVLVQGRVDVWRRGADGDGRQPVASLTDGAFFGEMALVADVARLATVTAATDALLLELTRPMLAELIAGYPAVRAVIERFYKQRLLENVFRANAILRALPPDRSEAVVEAFAPRYVEAGAVLCTQGEAACGLFLVLRGRCEVLRRDERGETAFPELTEGELFGEISVLTGRGATATVRAATPCVLLQMPVADVHRVVLSDPGTRAAITRLGSERLRRTAEILRQRDLAPALI
jgi:cAMP-dependent protein kinase regulator